MIVPIRTSVIREVVSMHVCLRNVVHLLYVRHKRMIQHVIALKVIKEILRQHVIHVRYLLNV